MDALEEAFKGRLAELAARHTQAEIARRCATRRNNVNRYLKDTRVPLAFGMALVREFGVNPVWLMTGEGAVYLADTTAGNERLASNLLDLVQSMRAVERMKLGSLTGRHHLKVLRNLNDAMRDFDALTERLNREAAPVFRDLLQRFQLALERHNAPEAEDLHRALLQVSALCRDPELELEFTRLRAWFETNHGDIDTALGHQGRAFRQSLTAARQLTPELCDEAANFSIVLRRNDRVREALQVTRATIALADDDEDSEAFHWLCCMRATAELLLGRVDLALPRFMRSFARLSGETKTSADSVLARFLLVSGTATPKQLLAMSGRTRGVWQYLLPFIVWQEDAEGLRGSLKALRDEHDQLPSDFLTRTADVMLDGLEGGRRWKSFIRGADMRREAACGANSRGLRARAYAAQLASVGGDRTRARKELLGAVELLEAFPPALTPGLLTHCTLMREVLRCTSDTEREPAYKRMREQAAGFLGALLKRGCGFLEPWMPSQSVENPEE
jgi:hypothetical protein